MDMVVEDAEHTVLFDESLSKQMLQDFKLNIWIFMLYHDLEEKLLADNTGFGFDGRTCLSNVCV